MRNWLFYWIRKLGGTQTLDKFYFYFNRIRFSKRNRKFKRENPLIKLPPEYSAYESYRLDFENYFNDGKETAEWIVNELKDYLSLEGASILDWGCGPARVVRHLPRLLPSAKIYGADYNKSTIAWCKENIRDVEFAVNGLKPSLPFDNDFFEMAYALSVFTHLSRENHDNWLNELYRVLKKEGIFLLTTQGDSSLNKLIKKERKKFLQGSLVERSYAREGHRSFAAFQPESFMRSLFSSHWRILKFTQGKMQDWGPEQDTWIVQKI